MSLYKYFPTWIVPVNDTRALHYVIVMTWAATGSRLARQLLHTGHQAAPPKNVTKWKIGVDILVIFFDDTHK